MTAPPSVLTVRSLDFGWPQEPALWRGLHLELPPGVSLLTGDEGCGKSTLLRLIAGELPPQAGHLAIDGIALDADPRAYRQRVFRTDPRSRALDDTTPQDWFDTLVRQRPDFQADALPALIAGFGLQPHLHKTLHMLSSGSQRKVWLCAALASGAVLTLLDEPFAALDMPSIRFLLDHLGQVGAGSGRAWLLADHTAPQGLSLASTVRL